MESLKDFLRNPGVFTIVIVILIFAIGCYRIKEKQAGDMLLGSAMTYLVKENQTAQHKKN